MKFDPDYIFVEAGDEFGQQHASAYADADTARISFGTAQLGLEHLLSNSGSAYLPIRIAKPHIDTGRLFILEEAPIFERTAFVIANKTAQSSWHWLDDCVKSAMA